MNTYYDIQVDNSSANSHNINIDRPTFTTFGKNKEEAVGKMVMSDWVYKNKKILRIVNMDNGELEWISPTYAAEMEELLNKHKH